MKKRFGTLLLVSLAWTLTAFSPSAEYSFIGTYGVCASDPAQIELRIMPDGTFTYQDFSNPDKKIDVQGKWEARKDVVVLQSPSTATPFHDKWKFTEEGTVAKSRKGMAFYRLGRVK